VLAAIAWFPFERMLPGAGAISIPQMNAC
jgi:hypothetical protein